VESVSDRELVKRFQRGDEQAFEQLVRRHQDRVYRLARVRLRAPQEAVDVAQEVFLRAYPGLRAFLFNAEPFTWLYRTMLNVCNEYNRRTQRGRLLQEGLAADALFDASERDDDETVDTRVIQRLVRELPARQQEVVMLRIFEELSVEDTARAMGCRPGTVKALLHKAMNKLRQELAHASNIGTRP
jgi:RNA polymerase sigma-70 factor (ECF subfamily)